MLDRIFTPLLMLAALAWTAATFAALPAAAADANRAARPVVHVELERVVVSAHREPASTPLARNESWQPAAPALR